MRIWFAVTLLALLSAGEALAQQGAIFVSAHISGETCAKTAGARMSQVFVYDTKGAKVMGSGKRGSWTPGEQIRLDVGEYWVGIGTREEPENLRKYIVEEGQVTVIPTGWVSVATLSTAEQPQASCAPWNATLRAYMMVGDKKIMVASNADSIKKPDEYGIIQLHPGTYLIEFHNFEHEVEVKSGEEYRIPTGAFGPALVKDTWLLKNHQDDTSKSGLLVCEDGEMHVVAGDYVIRQTVWRNDNSEKDYVYDRITVLPEGNKGYTKLSAGKKPSKARSPSEAEGVCIAPEAAQSLPRWGKRQTSGDFDDLEGF